MQQRQAPPGSLLLSGVAVGAGLMYLLDPLRGWRRRAAVRDKALRAARAGGAALGRASRDMAHRGRGFLAEAGARVWRNSDVEDRVLEDRVRSKMGHLVSHSHAIEVLADDGEVTLSGEIFESEAGVLLAAVQSIRGVRKVDDQLRVYGSAEGIPSLQGGSPRGRVSRSWPPAKRLLATTAGGALALAGLRRGDKLGIVLSTAGLGLIARGMIASAPASIDVHKTILVQVPIEDVFGYWAEFENFPRFMANVLDVQRTGGNCWHWAVRGPAGTRLEWDAELTVFEPERVLAWKSLPGSAVGNAGSVHFAPDGPNSTRVDVHLSYHPPAGALGHSVAALLGRDPRAEMDEDLLRFKSLMEDGETTVEGETVLRGDIPAGPVEPVYY